MILKITVENFKFFDERQELSMISSSKIAANESHIQMIKGVGVPKNAVVYGANASGKSNLVDVLRFFKETLAGGLPLNCSNCFCKNKEENKHRESFFEVQFSVEDNFHAYGFSADLNSRTITEEWLFELLQNGSSRNLFVRSDGSAPVPGDDIMHLGCRTQSF